MKSTTHITVLLAEDHTVVREGLRLILAGEPDIEVVGEAESGRQAVEMARQLRPSVVVMDISMPLLNGLEATRRIRRAVPGAVVLILSAHSDEAYVEQALAQGAAGYLLKQTSGAVLAEAIREVHKGKSYLSPLIVQRQRQKLHASAEQGQPVKGAGPGLSSREAEVLQLVAEGAANKQAAAELGISVKTIEKHRQRLMEKLNIHDTAGLTRYAIMTGVIDSNVRLTIV